MAADWVAIVGEGMGRDRPAFRDSWKKIDGCYDVRAAPLNGKGYAKYGTTFDNVLLVMDKVKPVDGRQPIVATEPVVDYAELIWFLAEVRNERPAARLPASDSE